MQSKGTLGSIIAGVIAIFLVLACLFYLSFSLVSNKQEAKAEQYATMMAGQQGKNSEQYNKAYKAYCDRNGLEKMSTKRLIGQIKSAHSGVEPFRKQENGILRRGLSGVGFRK